MANRRKTADIAIVVGGAVLAGLAVAGVVALAVGVAVAAVLLLVWVARGLRAVSERQALKRSEGAIHAEPSAHAQLDSVAPATFDDLVTTEAEAVRIFELWAKLHDGAPVHPQNLVRATELRHRYVGRLVTTFEQRRPVEKRRATMRRPPTPKPSLSVDDLWRMNEAELRKESTHFALCRHFRWRGLVKRSS